MSMQIGGIRKPLYPDQIISADEDHTVPPITFLVESDADAVKPFNLVYLNTAHASYKTAYVKNATALYGKGNNEGRLFIVDCRMNRANATQLYDKTTNIKGGTAAVGFELLENKGYYVRATAATYAHGDILVCAADGTTKLLKDTSVDSTSFRGHAFISKQAKTTTSDNPYLLVKYVGMISLYAGEQATTATLLSMIPKASYMTKSGAGSVGTMEVYQYPPNAAALTGVTFASSDTSVATVDSSTGAITAVANGTTYITATKDGIVATCTVVVTGISP